jgi:YD repeat-containing protein
MMALRTAVGLTAAALMVAAPAQAGVQYEYDSAGRLTKAIYSNGVTVEYKYDAAGNRTEIVRAATVNSPPSAANDTASVSAGGYVDIQVLTNDTDTDGGSLSVSAVETPTSGSVAIQGGGTHVRYTAPGSAGSATFTYTVADGQGGFTQASVSVTITSSNTPPVGADDYASANTSSSQTIMVLANDTDANGHSLTVTGVTGGSPGFASVGPGGAYVIYDAPMFQGSYSFTYTLSDGNGGTDTATVYVTVMPGEGGGCDPMSGEQCDIGP